MKKCCLCFFTFCCLVALTGYSQEVEFVIPQNPDLTLKAEDGTIIIAHDVYSMKSKLKRIVRLFDPKTNVLKGEAIIRLESANPELNMYDQLEKEPEKFSGSLVIESSGVIFYRREIVDGISVGKSNEPAKNVEDPEGGAYRSAGCTLGMVHDCVAYRIEGMNWLRYTLCLVRAPACYLEQWVFCTYDVCVRGNYYTNPN